MIRLLTLLKNRMNCSSVYLVIFLCYTCCASSQTQFSHKKAIIEIKSLLHSNYIVEGKIKEVTNFIGQGNYENLTPDEFVFQINSELLKSGGDKHLRLEYNPTLAQQLLSNSNIDDEQKIDHQKSNFGFTKVEVIASNVGYLKLEYFADANNLDTLIKSVFTYLAHTNMLIMDLRGNSGGSGSMLQRLASGFLQSSSLLTINYKTNTVQLKTDSIPLFTYTKPLYILCDSKTFSAGEGFAMVLQNRKRALIVGEVTAGAGNIAGPFPVDRNFVLTIPVGIIVDPFTGRGWEGTGVSPDIRTSSEDALETALDLYAKN